MLEPRLGNPPVRRHLRVVGTTAPYLPTRERDGREVAAVRGVLGSVLGMIHGGAHIAVATDYVIESYCNRQWPSYKTGEGVGWTFWRQNWGVVSAIRSA